MLNSNHSLTQNMNIKQKMLKGDNNHAVMLYLNIMADVFILWHAFEKWFVGIVKDTLGYIPRGCA